MKTNVTFRHTKGQHPALQAQAIEYAEGFQKFFDGIISTDVEFLNDTTEKAVQITSHLHGATLVAEGKSDDFSKSLHEAADKIIRQIRKHKTKLLDR